MRNHANQTKPFKTASVKPVQKLF